MNLFIASLATICIFHFCTPAISNVYDEAEIDALEEFPRIEKNAFLKESKIKNKNKEYILTAQLVEEMRANPIENENLFIELATSTNQQQRSIAYHTLRTLLHDTNNDWAIQQLPKFVTPLPQKTKATQKKTKITSPIAPPYAESTEFGIGGLLLLHLYIGDEGDLPAYDANVIATIKKLFASENGKKPYAPEDQEINVAIEILAAHCYRGIWFETAQKGNDRFRWAGRFVIELYKSTKRSLNPVYKHVLRATNSYINTEMMYSIKSSLQPKNPLNLTKEDILFRKLLLKEKATLTE